MRVPKEVRAPVLIIDKFCFIYIILICKWYTRRSKWFVTDVNDSWVVLMCHVWFVCVCLYNNRVLWLLVCLYFGWFDVIIDFVLIFLIINVVLLFLIAMYLFLSYFDWYGYIISTQRRKLIGCLLLMIWDRSVILVFAVCTYFCFFFCFIVQ